MKPTHHSYPTISVPQWEGSKPSKFKGGRFHQNHPQDQLDELLMSQKSNYKKPLGPQKKHYSQKITIGTDEPGKPQIRPNEERNYSTICFGPEEIPKLIKISKKVEDKSTYNMDHSKVGSSKMKNLQTGNLKTGIYRNFYKSQFKDDLHLPYLYSQ